MMMMIEIILKNTDRTNRSKVHNCNNNTNDITNDDINETKLFFSIAHLKVLMARKRILLLVCVHWIKDDK